MQMDFFALICQLLTVEERWGMGRVHKEVVVVVGVLLISMWRESAPDN